MVLNVAFAKRSRWSNRNRVGRISGTRHPATGVACCTGGRVPFTIRGGVSLTFYAVNGTRGGPLPPCQSPRPREEIGAAHCAHLPRA